MRDYVAMRDVMRAVATSRRPLLFNDFEGVQQCDMVLRELERLGREGVIDSTLRFKGEICLEGEVRGLTAEGEEFYRLIENGEVWGLVLQTLREANIDISYPLLKEVCEEIVKRYVTGFIPI